MDKNDLAINRMNKQEQNLFPSLRTRLGLIRAPNSRNQLWKVRHPAQTDCKWQAAPWKCLAPVQKMWILTFKNSEAFGILIYLFFLFFCSGYKEQGAISWPRLIHHIREDARFHDMGVPAHKNVQFCRRDVQKNLSNAKLGLKSHWINNCFKTG